MIGNEVATSWISESVDKAYDAFTAQADLFRIITVVQYVLFDFTTSTFSKTGSPIENKIFDTGDYVVFKENTATCPAIVIAISLGNPFWCILCGTECGPRKCDELLAMKCSRLEFQNLRILKDALCADSSYESLEIPSGWRASLILHQANPEPIIDEITRRYVG
jgi:hypothetical protein